MKIQKDCESSMAFRNLGFFDSNKHTHCSLTNSYKTFSKINLVTEIKQKEIPDDAVDRRKLGFLITFYPNSSLRPRLNI